MHGGAAAASVTARPVPTARFPSTAAAGPSTVVAGAGVQQPVSAFTSVAAPVTGLPTATATSTVASPWYPQPTADLLPGAGLEALHAALDAHMEKLQARLLAPTIATNPTSAVTTAAPPTAPPPTADASRQHPRVGTIAESGEAASQPIPGSPSEPSELPAQPSPAAAATTAASPVVQRHHRRHVSTAPPSLHISPTTSALPASPSPSTPSKWNEDEIRSLARSAFYRHKLRLLSGEAPLDNPAPSMTSHTPPASPVTSTPGKARRRSPGPSPSAGRGTVRHWHSSGRDHPVWRPATEASTVQQLQQRPHKPKPTVVPERVTLKPPTGVAPGSFSSYTARPRSPRSTAAEAAAPAGANPRGYGLEPAPARAVPPVQSYRARSLSAERGTSTAGSRPVSPPRENDDGETLLFANDDGSLASGSKRGTPEGTNSPSTAQDGDEDMDEIMRLAAAYDKPLDGSPHDLSHRVPHPRPWRHSHPNPGLPPPSAARRGRSGSMGSSTSDRELDPGADGGHTPADATTPGSPPASVTLPATISVRNPVPVASGAFSSLMTATPQPGHAAKRRGGGAGGAGGRVGAAGGGAGAWSQPFLMYSPLRPTRSAQPSSAGSKGGRSNGVGSMHLQAPRRIMRRTRSVSPVESTKLYRPANGRTQNRTSARAAVVATPPPLLEEDGSNSSSGSGGGGAHDDEASPAAGKRLAPGAPGAEEAKEGEGEVEAEGGAGSQEAEQEEEEEYVSVIAQALKGTKNPHAQRRAWNSTVTRAGSASSTPSAQRGSGGKASTPRVPRVAYLTPRNFKAEAAVRKVREDRARKRASAQRNRQYLASSVGASKWSQHREPSPPRTRTAAVALEAAMEAAHSMDTPSSLRSHNRRSSSQSSEHRRRRRRSHSRAPSEAGSVRSRSSRRSTATRRSTSSSRHGRRRRRRSSSRSSRHSKPSRSRGSGKHSSSRRDHSRSSRQRSSDRGQRGRHQRRRQRRRRRRGGKDGVDDTNGSVSGHSRRGDGRRRSSRGHSSKGRRGGGGGRRRRSRSSRSSRNSHGDRSHSRSGSVGSSVSAGSRRSDDRLHGKRRSSQASSRRQHSSSRRQHSSSRRAQQRAAKATMGKGTPVAGVRAATDDKVGGGGGSSSNNRSRSHHTNGGHQGESRVSSLGAASVPRPVAVDTASSTRAAAGEEEEGEEDDLEAVLASANAAVLATSAHSISEHGMGGDGGWGGSSSSNTGYASPQAQLSAALAARYPDIAGLQQL